MEQHSPYAKLICIAAVAGAHGVRGALKLRCFTDEPESVTRYGPVFDKHGTRLFALQQIGTCKGGIIARAGGINDRNAAEGLRGLELHVPRDCLPETGDDDEFYFEDLIGLDVIDVAGDSIGRVYGLIDHGAATVLSVELPNGDLLDVPFTRLHVPEIDLKAGRIVISPPVEAVS